MRIRLSLERNSAVSVVVIAASRSRWRCPAQRAIARRRIQIGVIAVQINDYERLLSIDVLAGAADDDLASSCRPNWKSPENLLLRSCEIASSTAQARLTEASAACVGQIDPMRSAWHQPIRYPEVLGLRPFQESFQRRCVEVQLRQLSISVASFPMCGKPAAKAARAAAPFTGSDSLSRAPLKRLQRRSAAPRAPPVQAVSRKRRVNSDTGCLNSIIGGSISSC